MHPELFKIGNIVISSYGSLLALSIVIGIWYVYSVSKNTELNFSRIIILSYILVFGGIIGARLFYVLLHISEFTGQWSNAINPFQGSEFGVAGLNMYGGIVTGLALGLFYIKRSGMSVLSTLDIFAPTIGIGLIFTRIGCFLNGCCFGKPTDSFSGVQYPILTGPWAEYGFAAIHPTQIYSSIFGLILFIFLHYKLKNKRFDGEVLAWLLILESLFRFAIEYVRHYEPAMKLELIGFVFTWNQVMAILMIATGMAMLTILGRTKPIALDNNET